MSFRSIQSNTVEKTDTLSVPAFASANGAGSGWIRNPVWPALPSISASDEKIVGLYAVYPDSAFFAAAITVSTGTVNVDWGDGNVNTYTSATPINYTYDFNDAELANTDGPVTFTDSGDTVNRNNHGYPDGYPISFASITTTTGIVAGQIYYVVNATTNTFQLSETVGGSVLPLTNDGSGTILPYKIATITITPNTSGATITAIDLNRRNTSTSVVYSTGWLDLSIAASCTTLAIGGISNVLQSNLEQVRILRHRDTTLADLFYQCFKLQNIIEITADTGINVTTINQAFRGCRSLTKIPIFDTSRVTDMAIAFLDCFSLTEIPLLDTSNVTTMSSMFSSCNSLVAVPLLNTSNVTTMSSMFSGCSSLVAVPLFDTSKVTNMSAMFNGCSSITIVPLFNTSNVANISNTFQNCNSLTIVPLLDTANVTTMFGAFNGCISLTKVPVFNTANVNTMRNMFQGCASLTTIPLLNTSNVTNMNSMFQSCSSLAAVALLNTANVTDMGGMFASCSTLSNVPLFNTSNVANIASMFFNNVNNIQQIPAFDLSKVAPSGNITSFANSCPSLSKISVSNVYYSWSVASCKLSGARLDEIYTNLPTVYAAGTAVTFQGTADTVTLNNHGFANLRTVSFATISTTTGISINTNYFVRNAATNTFQLSTTPTGAIINLVNDGSGTLNGQTITVTGNYGTGTDTPSIATAKGWTVTGS